MDWKEIVKNQKNLPQDDVLAKLYAFSRYVKQGEKQELDYSAKSHTTGTFAQLSFITSGCKLGQCSFCSYGARKNEITPEVVDNEMKKFAKELENQPTKALLFDAVGSIFDENEFSGECLDKLFENLETITKQNKDICSVAFETHVQTLFKTNKNGNLVFSDSTQKMLDFKATHPNINFTIELGFESSNPEIRNNLIFKPLDDNAYKTIIKKLNEQGVLVQLNVMATLPFLTHKEQVKSSAESVVKALSSQENGGYGANSVVLFPLNIRQNTFYSHVLEVAEKLTDGGKRPLPHWLKNKNPIWSMIATLEEVKKSHPEMINKTSIAWFGGRNVYANDIYPNDWDKIEPRLTEYKTNSNKRQKIVDELTQNEDYQNFKKEIEKETQTKSDFYKRAVSIYKMLDKFSPIITEEIPTISHCSHKEEIGLSK